jgi:C4-dicarboxylate-specific signal transduction histidine kinase
MSNATGSAAIPKPVLKRIDRRIGDLRIRLKLMVFHNVFFCLLALTIYLSIIPTLEVHLNQAYQRESLLLRDLLATQARSTTASGILSHYVLEQGTPAELGMPDDVREWTNAHPGEVWFNPEKSSYLYHRDRSSELYRRLKLPHEVYRKMLADARWTLTWVLLATYVLGVLVLEFFVLPLYVYRQIRLLLDADRATTAGDREHELVPESEIPDDELGDIMRSRNETVTAMRRHEAQLAEALEQLQTVTEDLRRKNEQLEAARQNLVNQDRLASLGLISASVAHELNTPLAVLKGSIEKLRESTEGRLNEERLARMARVTDRLKSISSQLLDFARVRKTTMEPVAVAQLIAECWELVSIDDKAQQVHFWNLVSPELQVQGNRDRLGQVFVNLLRNALHEITVSGNVWVRGSLSLTRRDHLVIQVEDDGPGIAESMLPHLFEAFVSTRLDAHGTGLGLTVAEGIIQQHGGAIRAYNRAEGGACLEVTLPLAGSSVPAPNQAPLVQQVS